MVFKKAEIEASLREETKLIQDGKLKEDNPLDVSDTFNKLCEACRRGDLKGCQEMITEGANINARDRFDYTPLILLLLETGALCERDTFQGERCLYNALNDRIRKLLLEYDYSKSADPLQPFAAHITSLLTRENPRTSDILVTAAGESFRLHKFLLSARSPYFSRKLAVAPDVTSWKLPSTLPPQAFDIAIKYLYFGEIPPDVGGGAGTGFTEDEILEGLDKVSRQLEVRSLWDGILESGDRRLARQRRMDEVERGRHQIEDWFTDKVLRHKMVTTTEKADEVRWSRDNGIFADILLRANEPDEGVNEAIQENPPPAIRVGQGPVNGIPVGPMSQPSRSTSRARKPRKSILFPAHRAMLLRSEYFNIMFSSSFREAQDLEYLQIIPIDCSPEILEIVLRFLYTEKADIPLAQALDLLYAADLLLMEKLKMRAAIAISTLGNGNISQIPARLDPSSSSPPDCRPAAQAQPEEKEGDYSSDDDDNDDEINIYEVIRAAWLLRVPRLEEFSARFLAYRLERYIEEPAFEEIVKESAARIQARQETDTIELLDDIRYYLSERFRLRFEDPGIDDMIEKEEDQGPDEAAATTTTATVGSGGVNGWDGPGPGTEGTKDPPVHEQEDPTAALHHDDDVDDDDDETTQLRPRGEGQVAKAMTGMVRTLDGRLVEDELELDAMNYQILLGKIESLLDKLKLDA
ncbi:MAG: hypothetical protein Q9163_005746 [Psora crenata]